MFGAGSSGGFDAEDDDDGRDVTLYRTTIAGNALAKARIGKPMKRKRAEEVLNNLLDRVRAENEDDNGLLWIDRVEVFGSYFDPSRAEVGDVDVHVVYSHRSAGDEHRARNRELINRGAQRGSKRTELNRRGALLVGRPDVQAASGPSSLA